MISAGFEPATFRGNIDNVRRTSIPQLGAIFDEVDANDTHDNLLHHETGGLLNERLRNQRKI